MNLRPYITFSAVYASSVRRWSMPAMMMRAFGQITLDLDIFQDAQ
ncbi:hypothetical protein [Pseudomonas sp. WCS374]|nr:hypothetical protein [Pseudomonas sp. WCS374]